MILLIPFLLLLAATLYFGLCDVAISYASSRISDDINAMIANHQADPGNIGAILWTALIASLIVTIPVAIVKLFFMVNSD